MNKIYNTLACIATATLFLTACDDVQEADRYIEMEAISSDRAVLIEDFTGQMCINCPDAHEVLEELTKQYGADKVIGVSIHCGDFGISVEQTDFSRPYVGLMTEEGNSILANYGIQQFPMGVINMGSPLTYDLWATAVYNALQQSTDVKIDATADYVAPTDGSNEGTINISANVESGSARTANIQFWIVEDGIVAMQRSTAGYNMNYVHNNVFRAQVFDGYKGKSIELEPSSTEVENPVTVDGSIKARYTDKERWDVANLSVVAFVSDDSGVLQVVKVPVNE